MLDMAATLCFSHERGVTEDGARRLLTLLTGAEAAEDRGQQLGEIKAGSNSKQHCESIQCHAAFKQGQMKQVGDILVIRADLHLIPIKQHVSEL